MRNCGEVSSPVWVLFKRRAAEVTERQHVVGDDGGQG